MASRDDYLILGSGAIGLAIGIALLNSKPSLKVRILDKEKKAGLHASGRNSGVLHAGFYYSPDSLKAKFCKDGNRELRLLATRHEVMVKNVGKIIVTKNDDEVIRLEELFQRGLRNGVELELHDEKDLNKFEPLARTTSKFLWSPTTAISSPVEIIKALVQEFLTLGGEIEFSKKIDLLESDGEVREKTGLYKADYFINATGAYSDVISKNLGLAQEYSMIPFMGLYRSVDHKFLPIRTLVYPVPHSINPFLGVHFTLTIDGKVKIGPSAIPIFGREQYSPFSGWNIADFANIMKGVGALAKGNAHSLKGMISTEFPNLFTSHLVKESGNLVPDAQKVKGWEKKPPGIRAQLVHLPTGQLEQDFKVLTHLNSTHVLNAVSPGWTSALPFARYIIEQLHSPKVETK